MIDTQTIEINIDAPKAYFLAKLTYPTAFVLDKDVVQSGGRNWWIDNPIGTGPFELKEYRIKVIGGLETLDLLESPDPDELAANGGKPVPPKKPTK